MTKQERNTDFNPALFLAHDAAQQFGDDLLAYHAQVVAQHPSSPSERKRIYDAQCARYLDMLGLRYGAFTGFGI